MSIGMAAAATAAVGLVAGGTGAAVSAPHHAGAKVHSTPSLKVTITTGGSQDNPTYTLAVSGPRHFAAGRVKTTLKSVNGESEDAIVSFKKGYTFKDLRADLTAFGESFSQNGPSKSGLHHLRNAIKHTTAYGGLDAVHHATGSVVLPKAGTYYLYNDTGQVPSQPKKLVVSGPAVKRAAPKSSATVIAKSSDRFGGSTHLPAKGTITFKNASKDSTRSPHFLELIHVKKGTTRKQVIDYVQSNSEAPPSFALAGGAGTDIVSPGHAMTLTYSVPKGEYAEACFFPDTKTGMPHAAMGMVKIVHLS
jgi:hypothetical protein